MLYSDLPSALERARERAAVTTKADSYLTELLQMSYGTSKQTGEIVYRPFYAAAKFLEQSRRDQTLKEADNAKFTGQALPIESLLALQFSLDQDLNIRPAFVIAYPHPGIGQLKAGYEAALIFARQLQPRGFL